MPSQKRFQWDEKKNRETLRDRSISFKRAALVFDDPDRVERIDDRYDYGEERIAVIGRSAGRLLYVVYTWRGNARRIISARKAEKDERRVYHSRIHTGRTGRHP